MRLAAAVLVLGATLVAALVLHQHTFTHPDKSLFGSASVAYKPAWVDPVALGIVFVGLAGAAAILTARRD